MMLNFLVEVGQAVVEAVDNTLSGVSPSKIIFGTAALYFLYNQYQEPSINLRTLNNKSYKQRLLDAAYDLAKDFPGIKQLLDSELKKNLKSTKDKLMLQRSKMKLRNKMPEKWLSSIDILKKFGIGGSNPYTNVVKKWLEFTRAIKREKVVEFSPEISTVSV